MVRAMADRGTQMLRMSIGRQKAPSRNFLVALVVLCTVCVLVFREFTSVSNDIITRPPPPQKQQQQQQQPPERHQSMLMHRYASSAGRPCGRKRFLGDAYGGWMICEPKEASELRDALVYTIGVGENIEWDKAMMSAYSTIHHGWDPTPRAVAFISSKPPPERFHFHKYGLSSKDGFVTATLPVGNSASYTISDYKHAKAQEGKKTEIPVLKLDSMLKQSNHTHLTILKIDIEGAEFDVISAWYAENYQVPAEQVLIEFHERYFNYDKSLVSRAVDQMRSLGFEVFHRAKLEISFIRRA